jgi:hypothetical protein
VSHSFYITGAAPRTETIKVDGAICHEQEILDDHAFLPNDVFFHMHRSGVSTRGVEVGYSEGQLSVRFLLLSSPEDYDLGFTILEQVAPRMGGMVQAEDGDPIPIESLRTEYGTEWIDSMLAVHAKHCMQQDLAPGHVMSIQGPVRTVFFGARLRAELARGAADTLVDRMLERIRYIQYIDLDDGCYVANVMRVAPPGRESFTTTAWAPQVPYLFPKVDFLTMLRGAGAHITVPYEAVLELAGERARYLDDEQIHVEAIDGEDWDAMFARAQKLCVDPAEATAPLPKKWWEFWK